MTIREELEALKGNKPFIDPKSAEDWAREHPDSALHGALEWDNEKAGHQYRLYQIRRLIAVHITDEQGERKFVSLSIDRVKGGGYREVEEVIADPVLADVMLADALADVKRARKRYARVKALAGVWSEVDKADQQFGQSAESARVSA